MLNLYHHTAQKCSKVVTEMYSTSFTLGIKSLAKELHLPIYSIYGFVRVADEIVDTFHDFDKKTLLERFEKDTYLAINEGISTNPILHAFQLVVNKYGIDIEQIAAFLKSMKMDLDTNNYSDTSYEEYIYGSAEVVGLMCLKVFCKGNQAQYLELEEGAKYLGSAFQKVNFLRDITSDYFDRGRMYFPNIEFENFSEANKKLIEENIKNEFDEAQKAILRLPTEAKYGVQLAYDYYLSLFEKIKATDVGALQSKRIRVPNYQKIGLLVGSIVKRKIKIFEN